MGLIEFASVRSPALPGFRRPLNSPSESLSSFAPGASAWELFVMAFGAVGLLSAEVFMNSPRILFSRYLWIDELQVKLINSEPSVGQSLTALKHSGDGASPVYYLLARVFWDLIGGSAESAFRILSFISMWIVLVLLYALLRRTFRVLPAVVAVLAFWSSPLIIWDAFFARHYAPLLAAIVGFCLIYGQDRKGPAAIAATAALAGLVCTLHYFGMFALAAVVLGDTLARRESLPATIRRWLPATAGPIALAFCWPFIHAYESGTTLYSYLPPLTFRSALEGLSISWRGAAEATAVLLLAWLVSAGAGLVTRLLGYGSDTRTSHGDFRPIAGVLGLTLIPIILAIFSAVEFPVLMARYTWCTLSCLV